jgi:multidrug resistance efflux pump
MTIHPTTRTYTLGDCTPFRQTLEARPPVVAHATAALCVILLAAGLLWAALTPANLVVRAAGRVRPVGTPTQVFSAPGTKLEGRVAAVYFQEGDRVRRGDVLLRLDTQRLENEIARLERTRQTAREELTKLNDLETLIRGQFRIAQSKAEAELAQARKDIDRSRDLRESEIRRAEVELAAARDKHDRTQRLIDSRAATEAALIEAQSKLRDAEEKLRSAQIPLDESKLAVLEQALELVGRDYAVRLGELEARRVAKQGEIEAADKDLANLQLEHERATLRAPIDGIVTKGRFRVGDLIESSKPVFEIAAEQGFCFEATVASEDVGLLREQMSGRVKFDAYDYQRYGTLGGKVTFISPDSILPGEQSAPRGPVYLVRVLLDGDRVARGDLCGQVKLGMAGRVEIVTGRQSILATLVKRIRSSISLG